jgi:hypothetical protein
MLYSLGPNKASNLSSPVNLSLTNIAGRRLERPQPQASVDHRPQDELCWPNSISAGVICLFIWAHLS